MNTDVFMMALKIAELIQGTQTGQAGQVANNQVVQPNIQQLISATQQAQQAQQVQQVQQAQQVQQILQQLQQVAQPVQQVAQPVPQVIQQVSQLNDSVTDVLSYNDYINKFKISPDLSRKEQVDSLVAQLNDMRVSKADTEISGLIESRIVAAGLPKEATRYIDRSQLKFNSDNSVTGIDEQVADLQKLFAPKVDTQGSNFGIVPGQLHIQGASTQVKTQEERVNDLLAGMGYDIEKK